MRVMAQEWIYLGVVAGLLLIVVGMAIRANLKARQGLSAQYRLLSEKLGVKLQDEPPGMLGLTGAYPSVYGERNERELSVSCYGYGLNNTRQTDTAIMVEVKTRETFKLVLSRKNLAGKLGQLGRNRPLPVEDDAFNNEFIARANEPERALRRLDDSLRSYIIDNWPSERGYLTFSTEKLTYVEPGLLLNDAQRETIEKAYAFIDGLRERLEESL